MVKSRKQAVRNYKAAKKNLKEVSRGSREETPEYLAANKKVADTSKDVPWWRR